MSKPTTEKVELTTLAEIQLGLRTGFVFCSLVQPQAPRVPVRDVRAYNVNRAGDIRDPKWTDLAAIGQAKGYEVLTLEGWHVPETVWREKITTERQK